MLLQFQYSFVATFCQALFSKSFQNHKSLANIQFSKCKRANPKACPLIRNTALQT
nr:MAG TPA: hypothetical protein [Caudoviricetes sp.]